MKLFYFVREDGIENFGDSLNPWLWNQLIAEELDDDETTAFVGIGTILNGELPYRLPKARRFVVFSSGLGYCVGRIPAIDEHWKIYCVRGMLSARQLGLPEELAIADGAMLIRRVYMQSSAKKYTYSFMPHVQQAVEQGEFWAESCKQAGIYYLDPCRSVEDVLDCLNKTEVLLTEAMHGAIAAEALRVPWIPIRTSTEVFIFKWVDWCNSVGLEYAPCDIFIRGLEQFSGMGGIRGDVSLHALTSITKDDLEAKQRDVAHRLVKIIQTKKPLLATDQCIESLTVRLEEKLHQFKVDVASKSMFRS